MVDSSLTLEQVARCLDKAQLLEVVQGPLSVPVSGVSQDSRRVSDGDLFLAWKGVDHDAHDFVAHALEAGAVAVVVEQLLPGLSASQLMVSNGRLAGALVADLVMGSPWQSLFLAGATGTNGKTTVMVMSRHLLGRSGPARGIGTLGLVQEDGRVRAGSEGLTTPGPVQISHWLREMVDDGVRSVALEASSHALAQYRLDGLRFDTAVFTNLSQDHLDYHADLSEYKAAKARLLQLLKADGWAVVNRAERAWGDLSTDPLRTLYVGLEDAEERSSSSIPEKATLLLASNLQLLPTGSRFLLREGRDEVQVELPVLGRFNVENALAAAGVARTAGLALTEIAVGLASVPQVPGRLERVVEAPFSVLIDYAHTPDALDRVLATLRPLVMGRLLVLFGAGGDRDRGKRPRMGEVAARWADLSFVTSDNPRNEDPDAIIDDILEGMGEASLVRLSDRREAIAAALEESRPGDLLLLAGKGHETYQVVGPDRRPFDEAAIVRDLLGIQGQGVTP